ncbi:MAG: hypothetical protein D6796_08500, partial [Caldilineae bacterium]
MSRRALFFIALFSALAALVAGLFARRAFDRLVTTRRFPVAAVPIEPYTIIRPEMLELRELPRPLEKEPIYLSIEEAAGKMSTLRIPAGALLYRDFAVRPAEFRYVDDPNLAVVSFPVAPEKAVGGQVRIGQRVDIWRIARAEAQRDLSPLQAIQI